MHLQQHLYRPAAENFLSKSPSDDATMPSAVLKKSISRLYSALWKPDACCRDSSVKFTSVRWCNAMTHSVWGRWPGGRRPGEKEPVWPQTEGFLTQLSTEPWTPLKPPSGRHGGNSPAEPWLSFHQHSSGSRRSTAAAADINTRRHITGGSKNVSSFIRLYFFVVTCAGNATPGPRGGTKQMALLGAEIRPLRAGTSAFSQTPTSPRNTWEWLTGCVSPRLQGGGGPDGWEWKRNAIS